MEIWNQLRLETSCFNQQPFLFIPEFLSMLAALEVLTRSEEPWQRGTDRDSKAVAKNEGGEGKERRKRMAQRAQERGEVEHVH